MTNEESTKLPRFSYQLPGDLTQEFVQEMKRDRRETPSELLTAIVRRYFEELAARKVVAQLQANEVQEVGQRVPSYGVKSVKSDSDQNAQRKGNQE